MTLWQWGFCVAVSRRVFVCRVGVLNRLIRVVVHVAGVLLWWSHRRPVVSDSREQVSFPCVIDHSHSFHCNPIPFRFRFGRRNSLVLTSLCLLAPPTLMIAFSMNFLHFAIGRFWVGVGTPLC